MQKAVYIMYFLSKTALAAEQHQPDRFWAHLTFVPTIVLKSPPALFVEVLVVPEGSLLTV